MVDILAPAAGCDPAAGAKISTILSLYCQHSNPEEEKLTLFSEHDLYKNGVIDLFQYSNHHLRGYFFKLQENNCRTTLYQHFFSEGVITQWNELSEDGVWASLQKQFWPEASFFSIYISFSVSYQAQLNVWCRTLSPDWMFNGTIKSSECSTSFFCSWDCCKTKIG